VANEDKNDAIPQNLEKSRVPNANVPNQELKQNKKTI